MDSFRRTYLESSTFLAEGEFIALDGDRWVGLSTLWNWPEAGAINTGLTGVLPEYRRRGIALALKHKGLAWARAQGIQRVRTTNASTNQGMLAIMSALDSRSGLPGCTWCGSSEKLLRRTGPPP